MEMDLTPLLASFPLFSLMEFGDKTHARAAITLSKKNRESDVVIGALAVFAIVSAFSLVTLMELGDKTQFVSFVLSARYGSSLLVFVGIMLGSLLITGSGVVIGGASQGCP
jgi:putative Ca2+/H+ antiporter (TMEM165/GDT1 family)